VAKQIELLHELVPATTAIAFLVNPNNAVAREETDSAQAAAAALGRKLLIFEASSERDLDAAVSSARERAGALLMQTDPFFSSRREQLVARAARHALPVLSPYLDYAPAGGLLSYGSSLTDALRLVGNYAGRILRGDKPADLPVQQAVKVELVINPRTFREVAEVVRH
jgi:putative ABC transport system substrate-binding protein